MGWKNVKDHYKIKHIVSVTEKGICIGSPLVPELIIIDPEGVLCTLYDGANKDLVRYQTEMMADPERLRTLVQAPDTFSRSVPVYTYEGGTIIKTVCEEPGWPNATHDGRLMYDNTFSTDKNQVIKWAQKNLSVSIRVAATQIQDYHEKIKCWQANLDRYSLDLRRLEAEFPAEKRGE